MLALHSPLNDLAEAIDHANLKSLIPSAFAIIQLTLVFLFSVVGTKKHRVVGYVTVVTLVYAYATFLALTFLQDHDQFATEGVVRILLMIANPISLSIIYLELLSIAVGVCFFRKTPILKVLSWRTVLAGLSTVLVTAIVLSISIYQQYGSSLLFTVSL
jgi:hypothetical protein